MKGRSIELQTLAGRTLPEGVRAFLGFVRERLGAEAGAVG